MAWLKDLPENYNLVYNENQEPYFVHKLASLSANCKIGAYSYIHGKTRITGDKKILIGKFCSIASEVRLQVGDEHDYKRISTYPFSTILGFNKLTYPESFGEGITIGNDVWIGEGVRILSGSIINDGVVIGAGSVVRGELQAYGVYSGNPCVLRRFRFEEAVINKLLIIQWWNWDIKKIENEINFFNLNPNEILEENFEK